MGWLYGDMKKARGEIAAALDYKEKKYLPLWNLIDKRVESKMSIPLHLAGFFLNPFFYYSSRVEVDGDPKFMGGFIDCLTRMYANDHAMQDSITSEVEVYQLEQGLFGKEMAKRQRSNSSLNPGFFL